MTRKEQILWLQTTVKVKLAPSPIHGIGVFAIRDIKQGERCFARRLKDDPQVILDLSYSALQEVDKDIRELILGRWANIINGSQFYHPNDDARLLSFMNHGQDEAENYDPRNDKAIMDIKVGEELLEDYRLIDNYKLVFPWIK